MRELACAYQNGTMVMIIDETEYQIAYYQGVYTLRNATGRLLDYSTDLNKLLGTVWNPQEND